jgi:site-specific DNA-methyltransferase (adenine-specific)
MQDTDSVAISAERSLASTARSETLGRFPANFIHDGSEEVVSLFPHTKAGGSVSGKEQSKTGDENTNCYGEYDRVPWESYNDDGSAARFFYCAKTSKKDRNEGLEEFEAKSVGGKGNGIRRVCSKCGASSLEAHTCLCEEKDWVNPPTKKNNHPTVKPTDLMRYLVRMVTPKNGTVLDPFMGSGSTGKAAVLEGVGFVGIELDPDYIDIARARIEAADPADYEDEQVVETTEETTNKVDNLFDF